MSKKIDYINELSLFSYNAELNREKGIIQQSGYMQASFSFVVMATLYAGELFLSYKHPNISYNLIFFSFTLIILVQILSLVFSMLAQYRYKTEYLYGPREIQAEINQRLSDTANATGAADEMTVNNLYIATLDAVYKSLYEVNTKRVRWLLYAQYSMLLAIVLMVVLFFLILLTKMI